MVSLAVNQLAHTVHKNEVDPTEKHVSEIIFVVQLPLVHYLNI